MYLQGVRGFSPYFASLILLPAYLLSGILAPFMGRLSDKHGSMVIATSGITLMSAGVLLYILLLRTNSSVYLVMLGSIIMGIGGAFFWPSNLSAIMANVAPEQRGAASGTARLLGSIGIIGSFIIAFVAAASAVPRYLAFAIFAGTSNVIGGIGNGFVNGIHYSFIVLIAMLVISGIFSITRGVENRHERLYSNGKEPS
jgi:MFS family permease